MHAAQRISPDPRVESMIGQLALVRSPLPADSLERLQEARRLVVVGKLDVAEEIYRELLERHPRTPVLLRDLVEIRVGQGSLVGALVVALRRVLLEPDLAEARENAASLLEGRGQGERARLMRGVVSECVAMRSAWIRAAPQVRNRGSPSDPTVRHAQGLRWGARGLLKLGADNCCRKLRGEGSVFRYVLRHGDGTGRWRGFDCSRWC